MLRRLRWHERLLLKLLARSPRIDGLMVLQFNGTKAQRQVATAAYFRQQQVERLEALYRMPPLGR